jgi:hypothetical protein
MDNQPQNDQQFIPTSIGQSSWYTPLCRPSRTAKFVTALTMVILPFIGGYVGYTLGLDSTSNTNVSSSNTVTTIPDTAADTKVAVSFIAPDAAVLYPDAPAKFAKAKDVVRYAIATEVNNQSESNVPFDYFKTYEEIPSVTYGDQNAANMSAAPFFLLVATSSDFMVFSAPLFKATEGSEKGLYKLDMATKVLTTMNTSEAYNPFVTGSVLSPDHTKIAVLNSLPWPPLNNLSEPGLQLSYIDFESDTTTVIGSLDPQKNERFCIHEMGCYSKIEWQGNDAVTTNVYHFEQCTYTEHIDEDDVTQEYGFYLCSNPDTEVKTRTYRIK